MKKTVQKASFWQVTMVAWLIFSSIYIVHDLWKNGISATYQAGYQRAFADVIGQSQQCQPFEVFMGNGKVNLINVACLEAAAKQAEAQAAAAATPAVAPTPAAE